MQFRNPDHPISAHGEFFHGIRPESKFSAQWILSAGLLLAAAMLGHPLFAADTELTNFKSGISLNFGNSAETATDKGVAYAEEYFYFDKVIDDHKVVYIKDDTLISMSHNELNRAGDSGGGDSYESVGADVGQIRYKVDGDHRFELYPDMWTAYTAPLAFKNMNYALYGDSGVAVVGSTGDNGIPQTLANKLTRYHRGILDSAGDEWHTLTLADDDSAYTSNTEVRSSDGKIWYFVVNPKTPCITWRVSGAGQFYTTPPKTYFIPKIYDQTTYFSGTVTCELRDINGNNVFYRINGGSFIDAGTKHVTLTQDNFSTGENTLEYYYAGRQANTKTRRVVKNPGYPSAGEAHGNRLWLNATQWTNVVRPSLSGDTDKKWWIDQWAKGAKQANRAQVEGSSRKGNRPIILSGPDESAFPNALVAKFYGMGYKGSGALLTSADYAKLALFETRTVLDPIGKELNTSNNPIPSRELNYRGYYDVRSIYSIAAAYDIIAGDYRANQGFANGLTPIEDYFIRDSLARWVHMCGMETGGWGSPTWYKLDGGGMWDTAQKTGAAMIACMMPNYSTAYYGTSGLSGDTTVFTGVVFPTLNHTWYNLYIDNNVQPLGYPRVASRIGVNDYLFLDDGKWHDRISYAATPLMGQTFGLYYNLLKLFHPTKKLPKMDLAMAAASTGQLYGAKLQTDSDSLPVFFPWIIMVNGWHPQFKSNVESRMSGASTEYNSGGPFYVLWHNLALQGSGAAPPPPPNIGAPSPPSGLSVVPNP